MDGRLIADQQASSSRQLRPHPDPRSNDVSSGHLSGLLAPKTHPKSTTEIRLDLPRISRKPVRLRLVCETSGDVRLTLPLWCSIDRSHAFTSDRAALEIGECL
jgi:hypothetical protein